mmetsp:Transcript_24475/g.63176  ORF Transcript_24475/g.63176 Transcript_24475/m.63176 type:complete len:222 (+) Transcript_24475:474-1139(+)
MAAVVSRSAWTDVWLAVTHDEQRRAVNRVQHVLTVALERRKVRLAALCMHVLLQHEDGRLVVAQLLLERLQPGGGLVVSQRSLGLLVMRLAVHARAARRLLPRLEGAARLGVLLPARLRLLLQLPDVLERGELRLHRRHLVVELAELVRDLRVERLDLLQLVVALLLLSDQPLRRALRRLHLPGLEGELGAQLGQLGRRDAALARRGRRLDRRGRLELLGD